MPPERRPAERLLATLDAAWAAFHASYAGLPDAQLLEPGVVGEWSVKDVLAHVSTWEEEALAHLPVIAAGGTPPRYVTYGGIDAFNARMSARKRDLPLSDVRRMLDETHRRLVDLVRRAPEEQLAGDTRFRRRLRLDTYGHYRLHTQAMREWRALSRR
jgi:Mycothiol maleylpyruvate isomerase N-terminal domain